MKEKLCYFYVFLKKIWIDIFYTKILIDPVLCTDVLISDKKRVTLNVLCLAKKCSSTLHPRRSIDCVDAK